MNAIASNLGLTGPRRYFVLMSALLSWFGAGILMAIPPLAARQAVASMGVTDEVLRGRWFSTYVCAFLLGGAVGGFVFGWLGDRFGRSRALGLSILTYSVLAGLASRVETPEQLFVVWFLACTGVGGAWPNGVSLAAEALPGMSRPWLSGLFGCTANLGLMLLAYLAWLQPITPKEWRWVMLVAASPAVLGIFVLLFLPESPAWKISRQKVASQGQHQSITRALFRPPLLRWTLIGIVLGTIPQMGNWGATNWLVPWANQVQEQASIQGLSASTPQGLSASTQWTKSSGALIGSLLGGALANACGRRLAYFGISLLSLVTSLYIFHSLNPLDPSFLYWVFVQGIFCTLYFGWLPLYLPELFPTSVRSTGIVVCFNWGRGLTAVGVLLGGQLMQMFDGSYARVGQITCLVYGLGMIAILFAPDTSSRQLTAPTSPGSD